MSQKFICLAALLLLLGAFSASPVLADWSTNFSPPTCTIAASPAGSTSVGRSVDISVQSPFVTNQITQILVDGAALSGLRYANYAQNTATATWGTSGATIGPHTISATVRDSVTGNVSNSTSCPPITSYTLTTAPTPTPTPVPGTDPSYGSVQTVNKYCYMNWWEGSCPIWLSWGVPVPPRTTEWIITGKDNFAGNEWKVCDYTWVWNPWGGNGFGAYEKKETCSNYSYSRQWIGLGGIPYGGTVYSLKGKKWGSGPVQLLYQDYAYGYRYQMYPPNISPWTSCTNSSVRNPNSIAWIWWYDPYYPVTWVDISEDPNFTTYYHKEVPTPGQAGRNSFNYLSAPDGFNGYSGVSGPLVIQPNRAYYVRLYPDPWNNGFGWGWFSRVGMLSIPSCPTPTPTPTSTPTPTPTPRPTPTPTPTPTPPPAPPQNSLSASCLTPGNSATLSWREMNGADSYRLRVGATVISPLTSPYYYPSTPGTTYSSWGVKSCRGNLCSSETAGPTFTCPPAKPVLNTSQSNCGSSGNAGTQAYLYWFPASGASSYKVRFGGNPLADVGSNTTYTASSTAPGTTYAWSVDACAGSSCSSSNTASLYCYPYPAWLRTSGGNVHSNQ